MKLLKKKKIYNNTIVQFIGAIKIDNVQQTRQKTEAGNISDTIQKLLY